MTNLDDCVRAMAGSDAGAILLVLTAQKITLVSDMAYVDDGDIDEAFKPYLRQSVGLIRDECRKGAAGWAKLTAMRASAKPQYATSTPLPAVSFPTATKPAAKAAMSAFCSFTRKVAFGSRSAPRVRPLGSDSLEGRECLLMDEAKSVVAAVFVEHAQRTPRFIKLAGAPSLMWNMQLDIYRMGSRSHKVVRRKATMVSGFFADLNAYG